MKTRSMHRLFGLILALIMSITIFSSMAFAAVASPDFSKYLWDAEALSDGTIAVLFTKEGTTGALYLGIYNPADDSWEDTPVGEEAPTAKEAALAVDGTTVHVAYVTEEDKIAYTYQDGEEWAEVELIESANANGDGVTSDALSCVDIAINENGKVYISYIDTDGAGDEDNFHKADGMYATNASGSFLKNVVANCTGWRGDYGSEYWEISKPLKIDIDVNLPLVAYRLYDYDGTSGSSGVYKTYEFHFVFSGDQKLRTNNGGKIYEVAVDGTHNYTLLSQDGKYFVVDGNTQIIETQKEFSILTADMTLSGSNIYYAAINGTDLLFYQNGTFVEDKEATTGINSGNSRCATVVIGEDQYLIYTGSDEDTSIVILKLDSEGEVTEFLTPSAYTVTITAGDNMTTTGEAEQAVAIGGAMTSVVYTADEGYCFPTTYSVDSVNGVTVTLDTPKQITVSGTPEDHTEITLPAPSEHVPGEVIIENDEASTCTVEGSYDEVCYCTNCEEEVSRETYYKILLDHILTETSEEPATCTETGVEAYWTCSECHQLFSDEQGTNVISEPVVIPALGHTSGEAVIENPIDPTCTDTGSHDVVIYCTVCEDELSRVEETIPALGHTSGEAVIENPIDPTCTDTGSHDVVIYCTVCEDELSRVEETIPALGHTSGEAVIENPVDPTCTDTGSHDVVIYCTVCEDELSRVEETIPALGHTSGEAVIENPIDPTCTDTGSHDVVIYCTVCEDELSRVEETIPALGHTSGEAVIENPVDPTCTDTGSHDVVIYCSVCEAELSRTNVEDPATGHTASGEVEENRVEATCTEEGHYDAVVYCAVCGTEMSREEQSIAIVEHTSGEAVIENPIDPTCTEVGSHDEVIYCTVCSGELSRTNVEDEATGHTWGAWVTTKPATTKEKGIKERKCEVCDAVESGEIPKKSSGGSSSSGSSSGKTTPTPTPIPTSATTTTEKEHMWSDADAWATEELVEAEAKEIIPKTLEKKNFKHQIDRTDFAAVAVELYEAVSGKKAEPVEESPFIDTNDEYVLKAFNLGITNGTSETTFSPELDLDREQMATMLTRALKAAGIDVTVNMEEIDKFVDDGDMHDWGRLAIYFMAKNNIIKGVGDNTFDVSGNAKIEEAILVSLRSIVVFKAEENK